MEEGGEGGALDGNSAFLGRPLLRQFAEPLGQIIPQAEDFDLLCALCARAKPRDVIQFPPLGRVAKINAVGKCGEMSFSNKSWNDCCPQEKPQPSREPY